MRRGYLFAGLWGIAGTAILFFLIFPQGAVLIGVLATMGTWWIYLTGVLNDRRVPSDGLYDSLEQTERTRVRRARWRAMTLLAVAMLLNVTAIY